MIKSEKGITIVALILTIVVLLILTSSVVVNINLSQNIDKLNNMYADLKLLEEKTLIYYNKYEDIPKKNTDLNGQDIINILGEERNQNDSDTYYEIDGSKLENVTLNYGDGTGNNIYIINDRTLTIYYLKGIKYDGQVYHSYPYEYSKLNALKIEVNYHYLNDNGENRVENISYSRGTAINELFKPTRVGYTLEGWYRDDSCEGEKVVSLNEIDVDSIDLFAKWIIKSYTITFDSNGADNGNPNPITANYGTEVIVPSNPIKTDNIFDGWYRDSNFSEEQYIFSTMPPQDITLYAKWILAEASIGSTPYETIELAIEAANIGDIIKIVKNINKSSVITIPNEKNIIINLNGKKISSSDANTITNNGILQIINNNNIGEIENITNTSIINNGTLTLGQNDENVNVTTPRIMGNICGISNLGSLNFYDGIVIGGTIENPKAIDGQEPILPSGYDKISDNGNDFYIGIPSITVAKIGDERYPTLQSAIADCPATSNISSIEIVIVEDILEIDSINIIQGQNILLNLNNHTISQAIDNKVTLEITDRSNEKNGKITSSFIKTITNTGSLILTEGTIENTNSICVHNTSGTVTIKGGKITVPSVSTGTYIAYGIQNETGNVVMNNGQIIMPNIYSTTSYAILNGNLSYPNTTLSGTVIINDGDINTGSYGYGVYNLGKNKSVVINGGNIQAGVSIKNVAYESGVTGNVQIIGGNITGLIDNGSYSTIIIGNDDNNVNLQNPKIYAYNNYNSPINNNGNIYFYDGILMGKTVSGITRVARGYELQITEENNVQTGILISAEVVAKIGETSYCSLQDAIDGCSTTAGDTVTTIQIQRDANIVDSVVSEGQNIKIDLNGKIITISTITNNGIVELTDTNVNKGSFNSTEYNEGFLNNNNKATLNDININATIGITNIGELTLNNTNINATRDGISTLSSEDIYINNSNIILEENNNNNSCIHVKVGSSTKIEINNTTIQLVNGVAIKDEGNSTSEVILNQSNINYNDSNTYMNNIAITNSHGGTIIIKENSSIDFNARNGKAIDNSNGIITLGTNDETINENGPIIKGTIIGIRNYNNSNAIVNFYDGKIIGTTAISGTITNVASRSEISISTTDNIQTARLIPAEILAKIGETEYYSLQEAIDSCSTNAEDTITTIEIQRSSNTSSVIVEKGQNIKIDFKGYILDTTITNNGTLEICDTVGNGGITTTINNGITNKSILTISSGIINSGLTSIKDASINENPKITINGATINGGVDNQSYCTFEMTSGEINSSRSISNRIFCYYEYYRRKYKC